MSVGDYYVLMETTDNFTKSIDFDVVINLCIYVEPTISTIIIITIFTKNRQKFLKSFQILYSVFNQLDEIKIHVSISFVRFYIILYYTVVILGIVVWILAGFFAGRMTEAFFKGFCYGIPLYIHGTIISIIFSYTIPSVLAIRALNQRLRGLRKRELWMTRDNLMKILNIAAVVHSDMCKGYFDVFKLCFPTLILFSLKACLQFSVMFMIIFGILSPDDTIFLLLPFALYGGDCFLISLMNDTFCILVSIVSCCIASDFWFYR